jgi:hypothetical protein
MNRKFTPNDFGSGILPALVVFAALVAVAGLVSVRSQASVPDSFNPAAAYRQ